MEFIEVNKPSLFVGELLLRREKKPHFSDVLIGLTVSEKSLEKRVRKRIVVRQRHLIDVIGVNKLLFR